MSYLNKLVENIETVKFLNKNIDSFNYYPQKELVYKDVERLNDDSNKQIVNMFDLLDMSTSLVEMRYVLSSDKLKEKMLGLDESGRNVLKRMFVEMLVYDFISADELSLYDMSTFKKFFDYSDEKNIEIDCEKTELIFKYIQDKNIYNDEKEFIKVLDILNRYSKEGVNISKASVVYKKLEYAIENSLENMDYKSIEGIMTDKLPNMDISYLSYISNNGIVSIYNNPKNMHDRILKSLTEDNDFSKRKELLDEIKGVISQDFADFLKVFEAKGFSNKEINTFLYKVKNEESSNLLELYNDRLYKGLLSFIYPNFNEEYEYSLSELEMCHYALKFGKKKFLSTYNDFKKGVSLLMQLRYEYIYKLVNLNSLTIDDIKEIESKSVGKYENRLRSYCKRGFKNISVKELMYIMSLSRNHSIVYKRLLDVRVDDRMRIVSDLPFIDNELTPEEAEKIVALIKQKPLNKRIDEEYKKLQICSKKRISKNVWLNYFLINDLDFMKKQVKTDLDVLFFVNFENEIRNCHLRKFEEAKKDIYLKSAQYENFISSISASEDFIEENKENIYEFFLTGMMDIYNIYNRCLADKYRQNLAKITKAELTGKLKDIKFYNGDLSREIGYDVSQEQEAVWKENIKFKGDSYLAEETDDYETIIKLGAIPVRSCMHYDGGSYNYCLLSNFDANKKILIGKNLNGDILGRAILRLTKISNTNSRSKESESLTFRDIENLNNANVKTSDKKEELVLFLEKCYTSVNNSDDMFFDLFRLAYEKAKKLGVRLMIADSYRYCSKMSQFKEDMQAVSKCYIYISKSKNGKQYLDSFYGSTSNDSVGYKSTNGYTVYLQENMLDEAFEKRKND